VRRADVRIVAASNVSLDEAMERKAFRHDLHHRLCGIHILVPPLRDRQADIGLLSEHFVAQACYEMNELLKTLSPDALERLQAWNWPGNVRELRMCIDRAVA